MVPHSVFLSPHHSLEMHTNCYSSSNSSSGCFLFKQLGPTQDLLAQLLCSDLCVCLSSKNLIQYLISKLVNSYFKSQRSIECRRHHVNTRLTGYGACSGCSPPTPWNFKLIFKFHTYLSQPLGNYSHITNLTFKLSSKRLLPKQGVFSQLSLSLSFAFYHILGKEITCCLSRDYQRASHSCL